MSEQNGATVKPPKPTNIDRLIGVLGFDPASSNVKGSDALTEAMKQVTDEMTKINVEKAKALLLEAIKLRCEMDAAEKAFTKAKKGFDKNLGKALNRIQAMANGKSSDDNADESEEAAA